MATSAIETYDGERFGDGSAMTLEERIPIPPDVEAEMECELLDDLGVVDGTDP